MRHVLRSACPVRTKTRRADQRRRGAGVILVALVVLSVNMFSVTLADAGTLWKSAIIVPGLTSLNANTVYKGVLTCVSNGNCVAGGAYNDGTGAQQAYVVSETSGVWSDAQEVATLLNAGGVAATYALSCTSAGNCTAGGTATDALDRGHAFAADEVNGVWGAATQISDVATLGAGDVEAVQRLVCSSPGNCNGLGAYDNASTKVEQPLTFEEINGVWAAPALLPGITSLNPSGLADTAALSCPSSTTCATGGVVVNAATLQISAFLDSETGGVWGAATTVPGITAGTTTLSVLDTVSCGAVGDCSAGGIVTQGTTSGEAFVISEVGGVWGTAQSLPSVVALNTGNSAGVASISCASAGDCSATGNYTDTSNNSQVFVETETNHTWGTAQQAPGISVLESTYASAANSISCSSPGNCSSGGSYNTSAGTSPQSQAYLISESNGVWATALEAPGSQALNKSSVAEVAQVSCSFDGGCAALGDYEDATGNGEVFLTSTTSVAPTTVAGAPRHVSAVEKDGRFVVKWSAPTSDGGAAIRSYTVVSTPKSKTCSTKLTTCTFTGLNRKIHYTFEVRATNTNGLSRPSTKSNSV
jgi:hypothetical protein